MDVVAPTVQSAWLEGLRNHGWIDGRNLIIEYRYAPSLDRLPAFAAELVALSPDLLIAPNTQAAVALKSATANIPIVFAAVGDPVGLGLVQSLSRPGGNLTGLASVNLEFTGKEIEMLREMVLTASKIAVLANPGNPIHRLIVAEELPQISRKPRRGPPDSRGDHGGRTRHRLCLGRSPAPRCNKCFWRCFDL